MSNVVQRLRKLSDEDILEVSEQLVEATVQRVQQELNAQEKNVDKVIRSQIGRISRILWKESQQWSKWEKDGPVLMPDNTRVYYRKGKTEVLLQEFPPQTRFLKFDGDLLGEEGVHHFSLALPYTIFIFSFVEGEFADLQCAFSDRPLKNLKENPLRPYLPNIEDTNLKVCLGDINHKAIRGENIAYQCSYVLEHFWQSVFCDDLDENYIMYQKHFSKVDDRLSSLQNWQDATEEDPLFVVDDVEWIPVKNSFGDMLVSCFNENQETSHKVELFKKLSKSLLDAIRGSMDLNMGLIEENIMELSIEKELEKILG